MHGYKASTSWRRGRGAGARGCGRADSAVISVCTLHAASDAARRPHSPHLPLEIVRSGTASIGSILPQGQVSAAPTPPSLSPAASMHINVNASTVTPGYILYTKFGNPVHFNALYYQQVVIVINFILFCYKCRCLVCCKHEEDKQKKCKCI